MSFLRSTLVTLCRRMRILLRMRGSRRRSPLVPRTELLLLFFLLLSVSLLHWSHRLGQRMRPLLCRLHTPILGLSLRTLRLWSALRFPNARRRLRLVGSTAGLAKRTEAILRLRLPRHRSGRYWLTGRFLPHQR